MKFKGIKISLISLGIAVLAVAVGLIVWFACRHTHQLEFVEGVEATCEEDGIESYWKCLECKKLFSDVNAKNEISEPRTLNALGHDFENLIYVCSRCGYVNASTNLTFATSSDIHTGSYALTGVSEQDVVVLPTTYQGLPVTAIESGAIGDGITRVVIPKFDYLRITDGAFSSSVAEIYFMGSVDEWANFNFTARSWIGNTEHSLYVLNDDKTEWVKVENLTLSLENVAMYSFYGFDIVTLVLEDSVNQVNTSAFENCQNLISVEIKDINILGAMVFYGCTSLESVEISNSSSVAIINNQAFFGCLSLKTVLIPKSVTSIFRTAFYFCNSLTDVYYGGTETEWVENNLGDAFTSLSNVKFHYDAIGLIR